MYLLADDTKVIMGPMCPLIITIIDGLNYLETGVHMVKRSL